MKSFRPVITLAAVVASSLALAPSLDARAHDLARPHPRHRVKHVRAAAAAPLAWGSPVGEPALREDLASMLTSHTRNGHWGAIVVSLSRGDTLFENDADAEMQPASTMKLMTTAVALDRFGPDYRIGTEVLRDAAVNAGTLQGNLYLRGGGDPSLEQRFMPKGGPTPLDSLAQLVAATGLRRVHGDIVADGSLFDNELIPQGWQSRYLGAAYAAPVAALSVNENVMRVVVTPDGKVANVALDPATTAITLDNQVRVTGGRGGAITVRPQPDGSLLVRGSIGANSAPRKYSYVIKDPVRYVGGALAAALSRVGVQVDGQVRVATTPATASRVAVFYSPPLAQIISAMNRESINHYAELLFRDAAHAADPAEPGSAATGLHNLRDFLQTKVGTDSSAIRASDGSGLSVNDFMTPRTMVRLLGYAHDAPWSSVFHASLPVAGESELLRRRMKGSPAQGNLHAKTGTTNTVAALAGYVTAKNGEVLAFSFIYNGGDRWNAKATMDQMGATMADFER